MPFRIRPKASGYRRAHSSANILVNFGGAIVLLVLTFPLFAIIPLLIKLSDSGPVFYRSRRLGKDKRPFLMYKFRSLRVDADRIVGSELLATRHQVETRVGRYLRETRLDELPQLFNVLRGEMDLIGPRPERPEIYERMCRGIKGYDLRFQVRPGVIGYSQVYTPHNAPKRLRSLIDSHFLYRGHYPPRDFSLLVHSLAALVARSFSTTAELVKRTWYLRRHKDTSSDRRRCRRITSADVRAHIRPFRAVDSEETLCRVVDLNEDAVLIECEHRLPAERLSLRLTRLAANARGRPQRARTTRCAAIILRTRASGRGGEMRYVLKVEPMSPLNAFKFEKYFLGASLS